MPALTTETLRPSACRRRESTSGQRSSPFMVEAVPSVIESPKATIAKLSDGAIISMASRKNHEAVLYGNDASSSAEPFEPEPGGVRYEVCNAFACQVIEPLSPTTWKLTASLRPVSSTTEESCTNGSPTGSLHLDVPGGTIT